jgi:intron-binding protein aquarius
MNEEGKVLGDDPQSKATFKFNTTQRIYKVLLDANQYKLDNERLTKGELKEDVYTTFNLFVRRRPKENNFKAILESIRDLMNTKFVVPDWLRDLILGYGDPGSAHYSQLTKPGPIPTLDFNDTFLSYEHLTSSFPGYELELIGCRQEDKMNQLQPPFRLTFTDLIKENSEQPKKIQIQPYKALNRGPYPQSQPKRNQIRFTPTQLEAVKSGMEPGLTIVIGPPGTGKTDVAVQIISNIYHNFPDQKTLIVTHSNQALNQIFEKIMHLDIDERHLLRLGHGEESLDTEKDFSRYGRVNYVLTKRLELLDEVDRMQKSFTDVLCDTAAYSCETAVHFYLNFVLPKWEVFSAKIKSLISENSDAQARDKLVGEIEGAFPFSAFFANAPQPLFNKVNFAEDYEVAKGNLLSENEIFYFRTSILNAFLPRFYNLKKKSRL